MNRVAENGADAMADQDDIAGDESRALAAAKNPRKPRTTKQESIEKTQRKVIDLLDKALKVAHDMPKKSGDVERFWLNEINLVRVFFRVVWPQYSRPLRKIVEAHLIKHPEDQNLVDAADRHGFLTEKKERMDR